MIVLDENIHGFTLQEQFKSWYHGKVLSIKTFRPRSRIFDDIIPTLLLKAPKPTFITTNDRDFWRKMPAHIGYCIITLPLPKEQFHRVSSLTRQT